MLIAIPNGVHVHSQSDCVSDFLHCSCVLNIYIHIGWLRSQWFLREHFPKDDRAKNMQTASSFTIFFPVKFGKKQTVRAQIINNSSIYSAGILGYVFALH